MNKIEEIISNITHFETKVVKEISQYKEEYAISGNYYLRDCWGWGDKCTAIYIYNIENKETIKIELPSKYIDMFFKKRKELLGDDLEGKDIIELLQYKLDNNDKRITLKDDYVVVKNNGIKGDVYIGTNHKYIPNWFFYINMFICCVFTVISCVYRDVGFLFLGMLYALLSVILYGWYKSILVNKRRLKVESIREQVILKMLNDGEI